MKSLLLVPLLLLGSLPAQAYGVGGSRCYEEVWREEYVPGNYSRRGYVRRYQETVSVPCRPTTQPDRRHHNPPREDNNSCIEGAVLGGLAGGALGAGLSRDEGNFIGIPLGIVGGALVGCQIDGG